MHSTNHHSVHTIPSSQLLWQLFAALQDLTGALPLWNPTSLSKNVLPAAAGSCITSLASTLATPQATDNSSGLKAHSHHQHLSPQNQAVEQEGPPRLYQWGACWGLCFLWARHIIGCKFLGEGDVY